MKIDKFDGEYRFLSNFYACIVCYEGICYPSSEHAYQAAKTINLNARKVFVLPGMTAGMAKHLGKALTIRPNWDIIKLQVMTDILMAKFDGDVSDRGLKEALLRTGDVELIEGNTWGDTYWGVCNGKGNNFLGKLLMELRKKLTTPMA
jgi:hypothetical protein